MLDYLPADSPAISGIRKVAVMSSNTLLLLVHETLSLDLGVQTLAGLHGQHNEAVFLRTGSTGTPFRTTPCYRSSLV